MNLAKEKVRNKVRKGADVLDDINPGWFNEVNVKELEMASCERCILGQIFESYGCGMSNITSEGLDPHVMGFDVCGDSMSLRCNSYGILADFWIEEIEDRKE